MLTSVEGDIAKAGGGGVGVGVQNSSMFCNDAIVTRTPRPELTTEDVTIQAGHENDETVKVPKNKGKYAKECTAVHPETHTKTHSCIETAKRWEERRVDATKPWLTGHR